MPLFISYSHSDSEFVDQLAKQLVRNKFYIWLDKWEMNVGDSLIARIQGALHLTPGLIVVLSKASVESEWCKKELESGLIRELEEKKVLVFPVVKDDCELPLFLRGKVYADFRSSFDEGLRALMEGIARVSNMDQGRTEHPDFHMDWAVDWGVEGGVSKMRIVLLEHSPRLPYSCYSEVRFSFNKPTSDWLRGEFCAERGVQARLKVMGALAAALNNGADLRVRLPDQFPKEEMLEVNSDDGELTFLVRVISRRLGEDTGRDVLVDIGSQMIKIYDGWTKIIRN